MAAEADDSLDTMHIPVGDAALTRAISEIDRRYSESSFDHVRLAAIHPIWITLMIRVIVLILSKWLENRTAAGLHRELQKLRGFTVWPIAWLRRQNRRLQIQELLHQNTLMVGEHYGDLSGAIIDTLINSDPTEFANICDASIRIASDFRTLSNQKPETESS